MMNVRDHKKTLSRRARLHGALAMALCSAGVHAGTPPSPEQMWEIIQKQQRTIEELKAKLEKTEAKVTSTDKKVEATDKKVEATAEAVETRKQTTSTAASWVERTQIGGYGELHYNNLDSKDEVDFRRFVLYVGHQFNDRLRFFSELEVEHAVSSSVDPGEVEVEQAWLEFGLTQNHRLRAGLDLVPVGIINLTHEPPSFYGVERNPVETFIIPTTWREAGIALNGHLAPGWNYDLVGHSGLRVETEGDGAFDFSEAKTEAAKAPAKNGAVTARLRYTGIPGLELGLTGQYQTNITQGVADISATLFEGHVDLRRGPFALRALYARWDLDGGQPGTGPATTGRDEQYGWYIEPSYRFPLPGGVIPGDLGLFARYNEWDTNAGRDLGTKIAQFNAGINYWPHPNVALKFDYQDQMQAGRDDGFNLGLGYQF